MFLMKFKITFRFTQREEDGVEKQGEDSYVFSAFDAGQALQFAYNEFFGEYPTGRFLDLEVEVKPMGGKPS